MVAAYFFTAAIIRLLTRKVTFIHWLETYLKPLKLLSFFLFNLKLKFCIQNVIWVYLTIGQNHFLIASETRYP